MKKNINLKRSVFISMACLDLIACGGGNNAENKNPNPSPQNLPNVFDSTSVKNIKFDALRLDNSYLKEVDLTKIAGHADYKIRITNPNSFNMNVTNLDFTNNFSKGNYYFIKNKELDNCFNQNWYIASASGASLNMPANSSCSFYTTSIWLGTQQLNANNTDTIDYIVNNNGFGFQVKSNEKIKLWCKANCSVIGQQSKAQEPVTENRINVVHNKFNLSSDPIINSISTDGFALGGEYLFSSGVASIGALKFTRYQVYYNSNTGNLEIIGHNSFKEQFADESVIVSYSGFATQNNGSFVAHNVILPDNNSFMMFYEASKEIYGAYSSHIGSDGISLQGLDNNIWFNSKEHNLFYQIKDSNYHIKPLNLLSPNLPYKDSTILGVDSNGNMVIKTGNEINCYIKNFNYFKVTTPSTTLNIGGLNYPLGDSVISYKYLYTNHANLDNKYYDVNGDPLSFDIYYQIELSNNLCQVMPIGAPYLVVPKDTTLIITDKYTAIKTKSGYTFASPNDTSDGRNNLR